MIIAAKFESNYLIRKVYNMFIASVYCNINIENALQN